jgi:hypothetical protein
MIRKFFGFVFFVALGAYLYWPYYATRQFANAIYSKNVAALDKMVDWNAVRESMKGQVTDFANGEIQQHVGSRKLSVADQARVADMVDRTASQATMQMNSQSLVDSICRYSPHPEQANMDLGRRTFVGLREFTMKDDDGIVTLRFRLPDLSGWKLVAVEIDFDAAKSARRFAHR